MLRQVMGAFAPIAGGAIGGSGGAGATARLSRKRASSPEAWAAGARAIGGGADFNAEYAAFLHSKLIVTLWEHLADEELLYELVASGAISANLAAAESFLGDLLQALRAGPGGLSCPLRINAVLREILQDFEELYFSVTGMMKMQIVAGGVAAAKEAIQLEETADKFFADHPAQRQATQEAKSLLQALAEQAGRSLCAYSSCLAGPIFDRAARNPGLKSKLIVLLPVGGAGLEDYIKGIAAADEMKFPALFRLNNPIAIKAAAAATSLYQHQVIRLKDQGFTVLTKPADPGANLSPALRIAAFIDAIDALSKSVAALQAMGVQPSYGAAALLQSMHEQGPLLLPGYRTELDSRSANVLADLATAARASRADAKAESATQQLLEQGEAMLVVHGVAQAADEKAEEAQEEARAAVVELSQVTAQQLAAFMAGQALLEERRRREQAQLLARVEERLQIAQAPAHQQQQPAGPLQRAAAADHGSVQEAAAALADLRLAPLGAACNPLSPFNFRAQEVAAAASPKPQGAPRQQEQQAPRL